MSKPIGSIGDTTTQKTQHAQHTQQAKHGHQAHHGKKADETAGQADGVALSDAAQAHAEYKNHGQMVSAAAHQGIHGKDLASIAKGEVTLDEFLAQRDAKEAEGTAPAADATAPAADATAPAAGTEAPKADAQVTAPEQLDPTSNLAAEFEKFKASMNEWLNKAGLG